MSYQLGVNLAPSLGRLLDRREHGRVPKGGHLVLELVRTCLDKMRVRGVRRKEDFIYCVCMSKKKACPCCRGQAYLDGHASAVEAKGEESALAFQPAVAHGKLGLGDGKDVTQVQAAIHVGVRKRHKEGVVGLCLAVLWNGERTAVRLCERRVESERECVCV